MQNDAYSARLRAVKVPTQLALSWQLEWNGFAAQLVFAETEAFRGLPLTFHGLVEPRAAAKRHSRRR